MDLGDARKLTQDAQETLRLRAVKIVVKNGLSCTEVAKLLGIARGTVSRWVSTYKKGNEASLHKKKRGRRSQDMRYLKPHQCITIVNIIRDHCPDQLKLPFALWTREAVRHLIETKFGVTLALNTVGNYLKRWGVYSPEAVTSCLSTSRERCQKMAGGDLSSNCPQSA